MMPVEDLHSACASRSSKRVYLHKVSSNFNIILCEGELTETVDEAKNLILNEEPDEFENEIQDENEGEFHSRLLFVNVISLKSVNI